jgi:hypothetical protein
MKGFYMRMSQGGFSKINRAKKSYIEKIVSAVNIEKIIFCIKKKSTGTRTKLSRKNFVPVAVS